ncbi:MAG: SpoIVB peptidase S55 domain-containing protein [Pyrinomonadaceae bacterium]
MLKVKVFAFLFAVSVTPIAVFSQFQKVADSPTLRVLPVSEVREGMKGTARTVFRGNVPEEFNVEILGVIPNWIGPKQDIIIGKLSGTLAERTFVFAGMSGSPVYIDGKLVGAISYSFPFAKEPICGITPFEQMTSVTDQAPVPKIASAGATTFSYAELLSNNWRPNFNDANTVAAPLASGFSSDSRLMAVAGQTFVPIATPLTFSGISQQTLDIFSPDLTRMGILPVAAAGGGDTGIRPMKTATDKTLLGGDSVVVHLARGDIQIAAAGTVTHRDGEKIYAFGHPFFSLGSTDLPMSESHVITVVPNANNSFKLAVPDDTVGAMTQDRATAIYGKLGQAPRMLPVNVRLRTSRGRTEEINFESALDPLLTPLIVNAGVANVLGASERGVGDSMIELTGEIRVKGEDAIRINRRFAGGTAPAFAAAAAAVPLGALLRANFEAMEITGVTLSMTAIDGSKTAVVDRVAVDKTQVRAGDTVEVTAYERTAAGRIIVQKIAVSIPVDAAPGPMTLMIGDGTAAQQNTAVTQFVPKTAAELIATINRLKRPDRLYAVLSRTSAGAVVGASEMPNLPPSVLATINNDRTAGGLKPSVNTIVSEMDLPIGEHIVTGSQTLTLEVIR